MSIGKNSVARAAKATAKPAEALKEAVVAETVPIPAETVTEAVAPEAQTPEKFKNVQVGDAMPSFLL